MYALCMYMYVYICACIHAHTWMQLSAHIHTDMHSYVTSPQGIISGHHEKLIKDVLLFISKSVEQMDKLHPSPGSATHSEVPIQGSQLPQPPQELFTAVLLSGVNIQDHQLLLEQLLVEIREKSSPYVVVLRARECNSGNQFDLHY